MLENNLMLRRVIKIIKELIDEFYVINNKPTLKDRNNFHATEAMFCRRKLFYRFNKTPTEPFEPHLLRTFEGGHNFEDSVFKVFNSIGIIENREIVLPNNNYNISGRADFVIKLGEKKYVVELKTINAEGFRELELTEKCSKYHYYQLQCYLFLLGIQQGILLYQCKNTNKLKEFIIALDNSCISKILANFDSAKDFITNNILPARDFGPNSIECKFCEFNTICWKEELLSSNTNNEEAWF